MSPSLRVLGIIPARAGSKGVPRKNVRPLAGRSLIERAFEVASASGVLARIVLSTDDVEAMAVGRRVGLDVPFRRPSALSTDTTPMIDVVLHTLDALKETYDAVLLLQPTSPYRRTQHIHRAIEVLRVDPTASAVCSVTPVPPELCPHYLMRVNAEGRLEPFMPDGDNYARRQDVPRAHQRCGTVFLTRTEVLRQERSFYGARCAPMILPREEALNIDTPEEWALAERVLSSRVERKSA